MNRLFDAYIAVDWGASRTAGPVRPHRDQVWVGERDAAGTASEEYFRTRRRCQDHLEARLELHLGEGRRVFLGFDFPYGYPAGFARSVGLDGDQPWRSVWRELARLIVDREDNGNNRFDVAGLLNSRCGPTAPGPFWGHPENEHYAGLARTKPTFPYRGELVEKRRTEQRAPGAQETWKLYGAGSVGSQALMGIPVVERLHARFAQHSAVWPFETGFTAGPTPAQGPCVLHAEIWPSSQLFSPDPAVAIKDQRQVRAVVAWLAGQDAVGALGRYFDEPEGLSPDDVHAVTAEEGWILGT